ncbi:MAG TPA: hypothetical protein VGY56_14680 [Verrucomicrobiae bacterium]|nr:hypothetical protein [Verrucomicrobiae bacterium]
MNQVRTAIQPPKACFGLEQHHGNTICQGCPFKRDCADLMGGLANRISVDNARFSFVPDVYQIRYPRIEGEDADLQNIQAIYGFCHQWVFGQKARGSFFKHQEAIWARAQESGASVKMFFLANMLAWKHSHGGTMFYPQALTGEFAVRQVKAISKACQRCYGAFDITGLDRMMGSDVAGQDFETHLLNSETVAGSWIVNYKLFHSGDLVHQLYVEAETSLHPYWLAIEPSFADNVLNQHLENPNPDDSEQIRTHRWKTIQVLNTLKRHERQAMSVFSARERIMPEAIQRVLGQRGLRVEHFEIENIPVVNAIKFWARLGNAIQHYECLKFVDNYPSVFDAHFSREPFGKKDQDRT